MPMGFAATAVALNIEVSIRMKTREVGGFYEELGGEKSRFLMALSSRREVM